MTTRKTSSPPSSSTPVFPEVTTLNASDMGITLKIGEDTLKKLDEINEETVKASKESQKFSWR